MNPINVFKISPWKARFLNISGFIFGSLAIVFQYLWNPDPHHDGIMLTAAIAVKDGLLPNRDFFAQYGPMAPLIQGHALGLFGSSLTGLRIFTAFLLIATGAMVAYRTYQVFGIKYALLIFFIWSLTGPMGLPWSSVISTFLLTLVLFTSFGIKGQELILRPRPFLFASQLLIWGSLVRVHLVVVAFLVLIVLVIYRHHFPNNLYLKWSLLSGVNIITALVALHVTGILGPYIEQSFVWAFEHYASPAVTLSYLSGLIWFLLVPLTSVLLGCVAVVLSERTRFVRFPVITMVFVTTVTALFLASGIEKSDSDSLFDIRFFIPELLRRLLLTVNYVPLMFSVIIFGLLIFKKSPALLKLNVNHTLVAAIAIGTAAQLYPLFDPWHLWMISPVFLISTVLIAQRFLVTSRMDFGISFVSLVIVLTLSLNFASNFDSQRYTFKSSTLQGMSSSRDDAVFLDRTLMKLQFHNKEERKILFLCGDGLYASASGHFLSQDSMFVNWGIKPLRITSETELIFLCEVSRVTIGAYLDNGWRMRFIEPNGHLNFKNERLFNSLIERGRDE